MPRRAQRKWHAENWPYFKWPVPTDYAAMLWSFWLFSLNNPRAQGIQGNFFAEIIFGFPVIMLFPIKSLPVSGPFTPLPNVATPMTHTNIVGISAGWTQMAPNGTITTEWCNGTSFQSPNSQPQLVTMKANPDVSVTVNNNAVTLSGDWDIYFYASNIQAPVFQLSGNSKALQMKDNGALGVTGNWALKNNPWATLGPLESVLAGPEFSLTTPPLALQNSSPGFVGG